MPDSFARANFFLSRDRDARNSRAACVAAKRRTAELASTSPRRISPRAHARDRSRSRRSCASSAATTSRPRRPRSTWRALACTKAVSTKRSSCTGTRSQRARRVWATNTTTRGSLANGWHSRAVGSPSTTLRSAQSSDPHFKGALQVVSCARGPDKRVSHGAITKVSALLELSVVGAAGSRMNHCAQTCSPAVKAGSRPLAIQALKSNW